MTKHPVQKQILSLVAWLGVTFAAAIIGTVASIKAGDFYKKLVLPGWAPPASLFTPF
jgi:tryptophan-rich sensory protein